jgi:hypothetical protein
MSSSKKITSIGTFTAGVYLNDAQYTYSHREGGVVEEEREEGNSSQSWVENTNMTDRISIL